MRHITTLLFMLFVASSANGQCLRIRDGGSHVIDSNIETCLEIRSANLSIAAHVDVTDQAVVSGEVGRGHTGAIRVHGISTVNIDGSQVLGWDGGSGDGLEQLGSSVAHVFGGTILGGANPLESGVSGDGIDLRGQSELTVHGGHIEAGHSSSGKAGEGIEANDDTIVRIHGGNIVGGASTAFGGVGLDLTDNARGYVVGGTITGGPGDTKGASALSIRGEAVVSISGGRQIGGPGAARDIYLSGEPVVNVFGVGLGLGQDRITGTLLDQTVLQEGLRYTDAGDATIRVFEGNIWAGGDGPWQDDSTWASGMSPQDHHDVYITDEFHAGGSLGGSGEGTHVVVGAEHTVSSLHIGTSQQPVELRIAIQPDGHGKLNLTNDLTLTNATLAVTADEAVAWILGDRLPIFDVGGVRHGEFAGLVEGDLVDEVGGVGLYLTYQGGASQQQVELIVAPPLDCDLSGVVDIQDTICASIDSLDATLAAARLPLGDLNGDHVVAFDDFVRFASNYSRPGTYVDGDFDKDGVIGFPDFLLFAANYGRSIDPVAAAGEPIPEPSGLLMLSVSLSLLLGLRSRRRRDSHQCS